MSQRERDDGQISVREFLGIDKPIQAIPYERLEHVHENLKRELEGVFGEDPPAEDRFGRLISAEEVIRKEFIRRFDQRRTVDENGADTWEVEPPWKTGRAIHERHLCVRLSHEEINARLDAEEDADAGEQ